MTPRITHPALAELAGIRHGFFTRAGGVSSGIYASLNCGTGSKDDRALVLENRARAMAALGAAADRLATPYQVHGIDVATVNEPWQPGEGPKADATVTNRPGIVLGIGTADCGPILFADASANIVGAAHAGWRGALAGVAGATIAAMERLGARRDNIVAVLGPMISRDNYEVGPEVRDAFLAADPDNQRFLTPSVRDGRFQLDLPAFIVADLAAAGVAADAIGLCTYADDERFFSYRRATHRNEPDYGRLLSAIMILE